jgi:hypothetical protein
MGGDEEEGGSMASDETQRNGGCAGSEEDYEEDEEEGEEGDGNIDPEAVLTYLHRLAAEGGWVVAMVSLVVAACTDRLIA